MRWRWFPGAKLLILDKIDTVWRRRIPDECKRSAMGKKTRFSRGVELDIWWVSGGQSVLAGRDTGVREGGGEGMAGGVLYSCPIGIKASTPDDHAAYPPASHQHLSPVCVIVCVLCPSVRSSHHTRMWQQLLSCVVMRGGRGGVSFSLRNPACPFTRVHILSRRISHEKPQTTISSYRNLLTGDAKWGN